MPEFSVLREDISLPIISNPTQTLTNNLRKPLALSGSLQLQFIPCQLVERHAKEIGDLQRQLQ